MDNSNKLPTTDALLVIKAKCNLPARTFQDLYEGFLNMKAGGVVLLPYFCDALVVPNDIKIELQNEEDNESE